MKTILGVERPHVVRGGVRHPHLAVERERDDRPAAVVDRADDLHRRRIDDVERVRVDARHPQFPVHDRRAERVARDLHAAGHFQRLRVDARDDVVLLRHVERAFVARHPVGARQRNGPGDAIRLRVDAQELVARVQRHPERRADRRQPIRLEPDLDRLHHPLARDARDGAVERVRHPRGAESPLDVVRRRADLHARSDPPCARVDARDVPGGVVDRPHGARRGREIEDPEADRDPLRDLPGRGVDADHLPVRNASAPHASTRRRQAVVPGADIHPGNRHHGHDGKQEGKRPHRHGVWLRHGAAATSDRESESAADGCGRGRLRRLGRRTRVDEDRCDEQHGDADEHLARKAAPDARHHAVTRPTLEHPRDEELVHTAPGERGAHERDLHEQHLAVAHRPQVVDVRQPDEAEIDARREHEHDRHRRQLGEPAERDAAQLRRAAPGDADHRDQAADPQRRGADVHPVRELAQPRRALVDRVVPGQREAGDEQERQHKRRVEERLTVEQPREVDQCEHDGVAERHDDERVAESRRRHRRQVAVEEAAERQLQRVFRAQ